MINFEALNAALICTFAEPVVINKSGGAITVQAVFDRVVNNNAVGGVGFNDDSYTLTVSQADIADYKKEQYSSVTVRGNRYQILEVVNDAIGGLAILKIRKFT